MNMKLIDKVVASYGAELSEGDRERLAFFQGLWRDMERWASSPTAAVKRYAMPSDETLEVAWEEERPVFAVASPKLSRDRVCAVCASLRAYVCESGVLSDEDARAFADVDFPSLIFREDVAVAGRDPETFLDQLLSRANDAQVPEGIARLVVLVAMMALRVDFEPIAREIGRKLPKLELETRHPLRCPVCGSAPALARVGGADSPSDGRGRSLYCQQCGNDWAFERVRCARCGTRNQGHLHFFNVEGDDAHRIALCDECGGYIRTVYVEEALKPFSYEVEEVVTARLDAIARDPRFQAGETQEKERDA